MNPRPRKSRQLWSILGGMVLILLIAAVVTLGSLSSNWYARLHDSQVLFLWTATVFIMIPLAILLVPLGRIIWYTLMERPGARFKTKMVMGAIAISLLPLLCLFLISFGLMNRTLNRWFPHSLELAQAETQTLLRETNRLEAVRLAALAKHVAVLAEAQSAGNPAGMVQIAARLAAAEGAEGVWAIDASGTVFAGGDPLSTPIVSDPSLQFSRQLDTGGEVWESRGGFFLAARAPLGPGSLLVAHRLPTDFLQRSGNIDRQIAFYGDEQQQIRTFKTQMLLTLSFFTILLLFATTWCALYLSKQVTVPIQALAEATHEIAAGRFETQVTVRAQDELGSLVRSFNQMTAQLGDSRRQIDDFTRNLQQAVQELDRRRVLIETVLENIPTGVLSFDSEGVIVRMNTAAQQIFGGNGGEGGQPPITVGDLAGGSAARDFQHLVRRALRMGTASRELQFHLHGRLVHAAVTVSPLGARSANSGYVMVVDDLTELLRAQKVAAWQEVAQRIAHEIRNPLTPIQLSAERLARYIERHRSDPATPELVTLVKDCSTLIGREVGILEAMVNEFSQFARFPVARLAPADPNEIVSGALDVFNGRLGDVTIRAELARELPAIKADAELIRRVIVNLIDNAAEAMEMSKEKSLCLATRFLPEHDTVEISVADSGSGISPEDKDKLFLPHFSTKERGTGLGLAIASRIIAEHHGLIRAEDNRPAGARFIIELPTADAMSAVAASET